METKNHGFLLTPIGRVYIRSRFWHIALLLAGIISSSGVIPSIVGYTLYKLESISHIVPPPAPLDEVLKIESSDSNTTIDLDNGKLLLVFDKNGETKLPSEIVVGGRTLLANPGQNQIAQAE